MECSKIIVNSNQQLNPVLKLVKRVAWTFADQSASIVVDYVLNPTCGLIFLSLKYHRLHPNYIYERLRQVPKTKYRLRLVLLLLDDSQRATMRTEKTVKELTRATILMDWTLLIAWSSEEAAQWLEYFKLLEGKSADSLRDRMTACSRPESMLEEISGLNSTDAEALMAFAGSLTKVAELADEDLSKIEGFGKRKIQLLQNVFDAPFLQ